MSDELEMGSIEELPAEKAIALGWIALRHARFDDTQTVEALVGCGWTSLSKCVQRHWPEAVDVGVRAERQKLEQYARQSPSPTS